MSLRCRGACIRESSMISCAFVLLTSHLPIVFNTVSTRVLLQLFFPPVCPLPHLFSPRVF
jgi:hypothetical protein